MSAPQSNALPQDRVLVAAGDVRLELREGAPWVGANGEWIDGGPQALLVLDLFRQPRTVADAMRQLTAANKDPRVWMQVSATIFNLFIAGVLHEPGKSGLKHAAKPLVKSGIQFQSLMLNDKARTLAFQKAVRETVKPGDVVLDLGTGTGILAITAAQCGAEVYAMEMTGMADVAARMFADNGVADRITLLRGISTELELPRKADVLVTEIIGDGPLDERVLEYVADARQRLLKPDARIIPARLTVYVMALEAHPELTADYTFSPENVRRWSQDYGVRFEPAQQACDPMDLLGVRIATRDFLRCRPLSPPVKVSDTDLRNFSELTVYESVRIPMTVAGRMDGFVVSFDLEVSPGNDLSTVYPGAGALAIDPQNAWRIPIWFCLRPHEVAPGDAVRVNYQYGDGSTRLSWVRAT